MDSQLQGRKSQVRESSVSLDAKDFPVWLHMLRAENLFQPKGGSSGEALLCCYGASYQA